jgi:hypothetical protein
MEYIYNWCGTPVSNRRPSAWQADALPTELVPQLNKKKTIHIYNYAYKPLLKKRLITLFDNNFA